MKWKVMGGIWSELRFVYIFYIFHIFYMQYHYIHYTLLTSCNAVCHLIHSRATQRVLRGAKLLLHVPEKTCEPCRHIDLCITNWHQAQKHKFWTRHELLSEVFILLAEVCQCLEMLTFARLRSLQTCWSCNMSDSCLTDSTDSTGSSPGARHPLKIWTAKLWWDTIRYDMMWWCDMIWYEIKWMIDWSIDWLIDCYAWYGS